MSAAGLLTKSLWHERQADLGFDGDAVLTLRLAPSPVRYADEATRRELYRRIYWRGDAQRTEQFLASLRNAPELLIDERPGPVDRIRIWRLTRDSPPRLRSN